VSGEIVDLVLRDPKGNEVTKTDFPVSPPPAYTPPTEPQASDYSLPTIGQAGRPVEMTGPFDGKLVNTEVKIGGSQTGILTQSPRKTVVESPKDVTGLTDIELTDGDVTVKGQYRSVALKLSADKSPNPDMRRWWRNSYGKRISSAFCHCVRYSRSGKTAIRRSSSPCSRVIFSFMPRYRSGDWTF